MKKLSIGLIGFGIWGKKILEELIFLNCKVHVLDLVNIDKNAALLMGAHSFETVFDDFIRHPFDGVIIASATSSHAEMIRRLNVLNIPLFVEKPLVNCREDLESLIVLNPKQVFIMHIWKYHPGVKLLGDLARSGELGEIKGAKSLRTNWTSPRKDTDALWNLAIHDLSICEAILGYIPERKQVAFERHSGSIRGATVLMGSEPFYVFEISNRYPVKQREIRVFGTEGIAILKDELVDYISVYNGNDTSPLSKARKIHFDTTPPLRLELQVFLNYLRGEQPPSTDLNEAIRLIQHLVKIEEMY